MFSAFVLMLQWLPPKFSLLMIAAMVFFVGWSLLKIFESIRNLLL